MDAVRTTDVIIIGGGLHGLSCALYLAQAGQRVCILEKDTIGRHASSANAGGVRQLGRALPEVPLACAALPIWHNIRGLVDDDCGFVKSGQIKVAETESQLFSLTERRETLLGLGYEHEEIIGRQDLYERLPALVPGCVGGMIVQSDGHANPFRTVQAFRRKVGLLGVATLENTPVTGVKNRGQTWQINTPRASFEAPVVINAAGAWGGQIAGMLGDHAPVRAAALMLMITDRLAPFITPVVGAAGRSLSFKQFENGSVLIGGGYEGSADSGRNLSHLDFHGLAKNAAAAAALFPAMRGASILRCWGGIEGYLPDYIPVIGAGREKGVFHAFGFSAHGFALTPIVGKIIADLVVDGVSGFSTQAFAPGRFAT
jgi:sarcosine oxidase subunit beta